MPEPNWSNKMTDIITGYYGNDGSMSSGWDTEEEAKNEFEEFYQDDEYAGCYVTEINGKLVIAYK